MAPRCLALQRKSALGARLQRIVHTLARFHRGFIWPWLWRWLAKRPSPSLASIAAIGDSTRIIEALERRWPDPPLYPAEAELRERALELDEYFDEELGPEIRRVFLYRLFADPALRSRPQTATRVRSGGRSCVPLSAW
jgi:hypothetical protein